MPNCLETALFFAFRKKSVIPVGTNKVPLISWAQFQKRVATEEEIKSWWKRFPYANIGLVCGALNDILVVDCDTIESSGKISEMLPDGIEYPIQRSPGGGSHFFFKFTPGFTNRARISQDIDIRTEGGQVLISPSRSTKGAYVWIDTVTPGGGLFEHLGEMPRQLKEFLLGEQRKAFGSSISNTGNIVLNNNSLYKGIGQLDSSKGQSETVKDSPRQLERQSETVDGFLIHTRDDEMFSVANALIKDGYPEDKTRNLLLHLATTFCNPPWSLKEAEAKVKSAMDRDQRIKNDKDDGVATRVREWILSTPGQFRLSHLRQELSLTVPSHYDHACKIIRKMVEAKQIERFGTDKGHYRVIDTSVERVDFKNASPGKGHKLVLPLGISDKTIFFPRSIVIVAGVTGFGKTTFLLNVIKENMKRFNFVYFSSEMDAVALNFKLSKFDLPVDLWDFEAISDSCWDTNSIQDKIQPNAMNVIDYLDPDGEKAYDIGRIITNISKKLNQGMALIATQKRKDLEYSAGGVWSAKASSLYLALDFGTINIVKNRYREMDQNPLDTRKEFVIEPGQKFVSNGDWYDPNAIKKSNKQYKDRGFLGVDND